MKGTITRVWVFCGNRWRSLTSGVKFRGINVLEDDKSVKGLKLFGLANNSTAIYKENLLAAVTSFVKCTKLVS